MIFVTGGTGLVGSHLLFDLTKKGQRVRALRRKESSLEEVRKIFAFYSDQSEHLFSSIEWVEGELLDSFSLEKALEGVTHIYHCAALVSIDPIQGEKMIRINVTGTANLLNLALEKKIQKFCFVSSVASLGIDKFNEITEDTAWNEESNNSAYSISKYLAENEVWRASQEGLDVVTVNPSIIIGPGSVNRSSGLLFKAANKGLRWYSSGGMGYVDVRDVVKCMTLLMECPISNQRFIISSENITYRKFLDLLFTSIGKDAPNKKAGKLILNIAWRLDWIRSWLTGSTYVLTKEVADHASKELRYSNAKIRKALSVEFIPVSQAVNNASKYFLSSPKKDQN